MNLLDVALLLALVAATVRGVQVGALAQLLPLGGLVAGLLVGSAVAPSVEGLVQEGTSRVLLSLAVVMAVAAAGSTAGQLVARALHLALSRHGLAVVDRVIGAAAGAAITAVVMWLVASMLSNVPAAPVTTAIRSSTVLRATDRIMPPAPGVFARVQGLLDGTGIPAVFAGLNRDRADPQPLPDAAAVASAVRRAGASTFKVTGTGCGGVQLGSSFLATPELVVTNAHVVAGIDEPIVHTRQGRRRGTTVLFDPVMDLAVLRIGSSGGRPLPIVAGEQPTGTTAAAIGFPAGGPLNASPAVVTAGYDAVGRDIYSRGLAKRPVYELRADVRPGNSGGPLVTPAGDVIGVIFSRSAWHDDVGFAIRGHEVQRRVRQAQSAGAAAVDTGGCTL